MWPVGLLLLIGAIVVAAALGYGAYRYTSSFWDMAGAAVLGFASALWFGFWIALVVLAIAAGIIYVLLRRAEENDSLEERASPRATNCRDVRAREPARLRAEPYDFGHAAQARLHSLAHDTACILGHRSVRDPRLPTWISSGRSAPSISRAGSRCPASPICCSSRTMTGAGKAIWKISSPAPMTA